MNTDYDRIAEQWGRARKELPPADRALFESFWAELKEDAQVLDLGCGTGVPIAKLMVEAGAEVVGVDRSKSLLSIARRDVPGATFVCDDIERYESQERFDGVILWDVIFHIERERHAALLRRVRDLLCPCGYLVVTSGGSANPPFTDVMFGEEFYYDAHPPQVFLKICDGAGFDVEEFAVLNEPDGGRDKGRIGVVLRQRATNP